MNKNKIHLNDGNSLPQIGFGIYLIDDQHMTQTIKTAFEAGYRLFDTASFYKNENSLGSAIKQLGIPRHEIQIATKAWPNEMGYQGIKDALHTSLDKLQTDYVDFYFIHWPIKDKKKLSETWTAMEEMKDEGLIRSIAVCNFNPHHFDAIQAGHRYAPVINQIERHPLLSQEDILNYNRSHGIATQAWAPLMHGNNVLNMEVIRELALKYRKTPAQIILNWDIQQGVVPIPKSATPSRIEENYHALEFALSREDMRKIDALNSNERYGKDPDSYPFSLS